jgi:protein SERAC1
MSSKSSIFDNKYYNINNQNLSIVFVHGLMGDAYATWEKDKVLWPRELLGTTFPTARIITYGYDADVVRLFSRVSTNTIFAHSRGLIKAMHRMRVSITEVGNAIP